MLKNPHEFCYQTDNIGDLLIRHSNRNDKEGYDTLEVLKDKKVLTTIQLPFTTRPVNAMLMIDKAVEALQYVG